MDDSEDSLMEAIYHHCDFIICHANHLYSLRTRIMADVSYCLELG